MKKLAVLTAALVASAATIAPLTSVPAQAQELRVHVNYADLDITSAEGAAALTSRIEASVSKACARSTDFRGLKAAAQCEDALLSEAEAQLAAQG